MKKVTLAFILIFNLSLTSCDPDTLYGGELIKEHKVATNCCAEHGQLPAEPDDDE